MKAPLEAASPDKAWHLRFQLLGIYRESGADPQHTRALRLVWQFWFQKDETFIGFSSLVWNATE